VLLFLSPCGDGQRRRSHGERVVSHNRANERGIAFNAASQITLMFYFETVTWLEKGLGDWSISAADLPCLLERGVAELARKVIQPTPGYIRLGLPV
jgi:hypothetical protein